MSFSINRSIWEDPANPEVICVIDQRLLPHQMKIAELRTVQDAAQAIQEMWVRGAPLIGATAAYGMHLAAQQATEMREVNIGFFEKSATLLLATRPTAVNLQWALRQQMQLMRHAVSLEKRVQESLALARQIVEEDAAACKAIGQHGLPLIRDIFEKTGKPVQILTHCNAGRMACIEWGTATSPIYQAHQAGIPVHVWVDETRPRNQGARITAWELGEAGVPHTLITDNAGGHLMQHGMVDICFVGSDRTTLHGDVGNKIGTYLKALAAQDNSVPFYVALPSSTFDFEMGDGLKEMDIEQRDSREVTHVNGWSDKLEAMEAVRISPESSPAANFAFDVTPAKLVTGLITERGICAANKAAISEMFADLI